MRNPNESLDDKVTKRPLERSSEVSHDVSPGLVDEPEAPVDREVSEPASNTFLFWVHRFVAVGSVLALITFILLIGLSAILFVIGEPATERNVTTSVRPAEHKATTASEHRYEDGATSGDQSEATINDEQVDELALMTDGQPGDDQTETEESLSSNIFSTPNSSRRKSTHSKARPRRARRFRVARYVSRRPPRWQPKPLEPLFIPTTLVIYVENGVIKTRIEPWIQTPRTPNN